MYCMVNDLQTGGFDNASGLSVPQDGVTVRPRGELTIAGQNMYRSVMARLEQSGYTEGETMQRHNYDWRLSVAHWSRASFPTLQHIVEDLVKNSGGAGAVLTGVSMAGPYTHAFLSWAAHNDASWTARYVHAFAPIDGPWNGAADALMSLISSSLGSFTATGDCPGCTPQPKTNIPAPQDWWSGFLNGLKHELVNELMDANIRGFPSIYWVSTGYDASTSPPSDPDVITLVNGAMVPECVADSENGVSCGANGTRGGDVFDNPDFLQSDECAECYKLLGFNNDCRSGFEVAYDGWTYDLCCKRHTCTPKTYKASELPELLQQVGRQTNADMMRHALNTGTTADPGVPVHCIYSHNIQTIAAPLRFATTDALQASGYVQFDDGDGTVDLPSLEVCTRWPSTVKAYTFPDMVHASTLGIVELAELIEAIATNNDGYWRDWQSPSRQDIISRNANASVAPETRVFALTEEILI
eukprot:NODE_5444_length_1769_cov_13.975030.p1 GENE.NODE_5444_length_1769_cov_13.975030~~NODE_5444_length_1769_cov_13.975030.p1  ORF type:complete len:470 (+),score=103.32 NODE_5444_length_1769_cov_13.975030:2-1411(+)